MNFRQVRKKIKSISNVKKITRAMQLVSAVKMKKAQQAVIEGRPYRDTLSSIIQKISGKVDSSSSPLIGARKIKKGRELVIFISSNKGLCGGFHLNLQRFLLKNQDFENADFITVGKKGALFIAKTHSKVIADFSGHNPLVEVSAIFNLAVSNYLMEQYEKVSIVYNLFISSLRSEQKKEVILPIELPKAADAEKTMNKEYIIEPSPERIIDSLLRSYVEEKIRGAMMSSLAVEHSSRMLAMKNATDNATDVIYNLTLLGNKLRQSKITMELLDMITAKESVESS